MVASGGGRERAGHGRWGERGRGEEQRVGAATGATERAHWAARTREGGARRRVRGEGQRGVERGEASQGGFVGSGAVGAGSAGEEETVDGAA